MPEGIDAAGRAAMIAYWGLDGLLLDQYLLFWRSLFAGEFGLGLMERRPVVEIFAERMGRSLALLATLCIGVPLGVLAAMWRQRAIGGWLLLVAFLGYAIPNFVLAILLLLLFSFTLHWLPSAGTTTGWHYIMPVATLAAYFIAALVRYTRNPMLDVLGQDYIRTAHAKGLSPAVVLIRHGLRNALIPVVTVLGLAYWAQFARLVRGQMLALRELPYVEAARAVGATPWRVAVRHMVIDAQKGRLPTGGNAAVMFTNGVKVTQTMVDDLALLVEQKATPEDTLKTMAAEVQKLLPR